MPAGDGKLGLLVAAVLLAKGGTDVTLLGRHAHKMDLVKGLAGRVVIKEDVGGTATSEGTGTADAISQQLAGAFDACVEASGSSTGIHLALAITRPLGTVVLKTTGMLSSSEVAAAVPSGERSPLGGLVT